MRTLTRRFAPHAGRAWLALTTLTVLVVAAVVVAVLTSGGGRPAVVATMFAGLVVFGVLAAFLDAILVPGDPDNRRTTVHAVGWTGTVGTGGWSGGDGHGGGDGGSCG